MRFLVDAALSPVVAAGLRAVGHDALHVGDCTELDAADEAILALAESHTRVLVTADTDFGTILAIRGGSRPSVVLFRLSTGRTPTRHVELLVGNLPNIQQALEAGSIIVIEEYRIRVRPLPILG